MKAWQILSTLGEAPDRVSPAVARLGLVFDACQAGVVLRAVLASEAVAGVALAFAADGPLDWLGRLAQATAGVLPAVLFWLVAACAVRRPLARLPLAGQYAAGVALGALAGLYGCGLVHLADLLVRPPWVASAAAGALGAAALVTALVWRARARAPAATTARLADLQSRIRPHFLFNTLNSAIALVRDEPERAEGLLEDLSDLFRAALAEQGEAVTVDEEIALARRYLAIEQVRFGDRLVVDWSLDPAAGGARLPPLLLQPLVENAVRHGVEPSPEGARLRIRTERRGDRVRIEVANTLPAGPGPAGLGMALDNVRDRLALLHDLQASFRTALEGGEWRVRLEVPA